MRITLKRSIRSRKFDGYLPLDCVLEAERRDGFIWGYHPDLDNNPVRIAFDNIKDYLDEHEIHTGSENHSDIKAQESK